MTALPKHRFTTFKQAFVRGDEAAMRRIARIMAAEMRDPAKGAEPGYDGEPPKHLPARDIEGVDKWTGKRVRETPKSDMNVNTSRLAWLLARDHITKRQAKAGSNLFDDWYFSQRIQYSQMGVLAGISGRTDYTPAQAKLEAAQRFHAAASALKAASQRAWQMVDLVVLQELSVERASARLHIKSTRGFGNLEAGLDILASHYRLPKDS